MEKKLYTTPSVNKIEVATADVITLSPVSEVASFDDGMQMGFGDF